jgi:hypothetical protein
MNVVLLCIRMLRVFPHVQVVFLEDMPEKSSDGLRQFLGFDLPRAHCYYDAARVTRYPPASLPTSAEAITENLKQIYAEWRLFPEQNILPQIEQKEGSEHNRSPYYLGHMHNLVIDAMSRSVPPARVASCG